MLRIRFIQDHKNNKSGEIKEVSRNEAFGLIDKGVAIISKDITQRVVKVKKKKVKRGDNI